MTPVLALLSVGGALLVGAASPGPSFLVVARTAASGSRGQGVASALGMGAGGFIFAVLALAGLRSLLAQAGWIDGTLKIAGGAFLLYLAGRVWKQAGVPLTAGVKGRSPGSRLRAFRTGFATQISNPKTAAVYASLFAALLPPSLTPTMTAAVLAVVTCVESGWYCVVAVAFSANRPRAAYLRFKTTVDRVAASVMGLLGARLVVSALGPD